MMTILNIFRCVRTYEIYHAKARNYHYMMHKNSMKSIKKYSWKNISGDQHIPFHSFTYELINENDSFKGNTHILQNCTDLLQ